MKTTLHSSTPSFLPILAGVLSICLLVAPDALGGCNKWGKGNDCGPDPNPLVAGAAVIEIDDQTPCTCMGADHPMPEMWMGPMSCESAVGISHEAGEYNCTVQPLDIVVAMTHHMSMNFNPKYAKICNSLAFDAVSVGHPDEVSFGWTDDCSDGSCALEMNLEFSGPRILEVTNGASDALSVVLHGAIATASGDNGNPFLLPREIGFDSMDLVFLKPGSTRIAGLCTLYMDGSEALSVTPAAAP